MLDDYTGYKIFYRENTSDEAVIGHSFAHDIFYPAIPDLTVNNRMVIIDIGGHIGTFSLLSEKKFPNGQVYVFEPDSENYSLLKRNVVENNLKTITFFNKAVTNKNGFTELFLDKENWGHSTSSKISEDILKVETIDINSFFEQEQIAKCDLIKFNCEGAEFDIILSMGKSVLQSTGMMLILYHEDLASSTEKNLSSLYRFLKKNNFYCRVVNKTASRGWLIAKNKRFYKRDITTVEGIKIILKEIRTIFKIRNQN